MLFVQLHIKLSSQVVLELLAALISMLLGLSKFKLQLLVVLASTLEGLLGGFELGSLLMKLRLFFLELLLQHLFSLLALGLQLVERSVAILVSRLNLLFHGALQGLDLARGLLELGLELGSLFLLDLLLDQLALRLELGSELLLGLGLDGCLLLVELLLHLGLGLAQKLLAGHLLLLQVLSLLSRQLHEALLLLLGVRLGSQRLLGKGLFALSEFLSLSLEARLLGFKSLLLLLQQSHLVLVFFVLRRKLLLVLEVEADALNDEVLLGLHLFLGPGIKSMLLVSEGFLLFDQFSVFGLVLVLLSLQFSQFTLQMSSFGGLSLLLLAQVGFLLLELALVLLDSLLFLHELSLFALDALLSLIFLLLSGLLLVLHSEIAHLGNQVLALLSSCLSLVLLVQRRLHPGGHVLSLGCIFGRLRVLLNIRSAIGCRGVLAGIESGRLGLMRFILSIIMSWLVVVYFNVSNRVRTIIIVFFFIIACLIRCLFFIVILVILN